MRYRYDKAISLALIFLMLLAPSFVLVAASESWGIMTWAPDTMFEADWIGTLVQTQGNIQVWEIELVPSKMMGSGMMMGKWVEMTLVWDTLAQTGEVIDFAHFGMNLHFTGWGGTIWYTPGYHFQFGGIGVGTYNSSGTLYPCEIRGFFEGDYYPLNSTTPFMEGFCGWSEFIERATLRYGMPPVGGEVIPVDKMAVSAPYFGLLALVAALSVATTFVIRRKFWN